MTLELKKFDMRWITFKPDENKGPVIVMIGRRDTGKSFLVRDLLYHHKIFLLERLYLEQKLVMVFMLRMCLNCSFMKNITLF